MSFVFKTWRGPAAGLLDLTFDCDTSVGGNEVTRKRECKLSLLTIVGLKKSSSKTGTEIRKTFS